MPANENNAPDTTDALTYELTITRLFNAPRELVWRAWTEAAMAGRWMGPRGFAVLEIDARREVGKDWNLTVAGRRAEKMVTMAQHGRTLEVVPPEKLVYTFAWDDRSVVGLGPSPFQENIITILLEEQGEQTLMTFIQKPFATEGERDGHNGGWNGALDKLNDFLETGVDQN